MCFIFRSWLNSEVDVHVPFFSELSSLSGSGGVTGPGFFSMSPSTVMSSNILPAHVQIRMRANVKLPLPKGEDVGEKTTSAVPLQDGDR